MKTKDCYISLRQWFPFLRWPRPSATSFSRDAWAGITVGLVLIPQAVAYATLAGMPPQTGLYAAMLPSVIGILWGSSSLLAVGPVALTSMLVFGSLSPLANPGSAEWVTLAIWLSLYSGVIQFLLGAFRFGRIAHLVSQPVVTGFINAAAILIVLSQIPALFGMSGLSTRHVIDALPRLLVPASAQQIAVGFGFGAMALLLLLNHLLPKIPGMLLVTLLAIAVSWIFEYDKHGGQIVGKLPAGIPALSFPSVISFSRHQELWPAALIVALISFTEAMSSCRALARKQRERWNENQELIGQGLAKIASAFCGAFPVSGSFSRSALNLYAGATSAWSTLFSALCVLLALLFLTDVISFLPRPVLAAMIMLPVFSLLDFAAIRRLFFVSRDDGTVATVTFVTTLLSAPRLHWGVIAGVALSMALYLYRRIRPRIVEVGLHPNGTLRNRSRFELPRLAHALLAVRMDASLNFLTATSLEKFVIDCCREDESIRGVLLCASGINEIDATGLDVLQTLHAALQSEGICLYVSGVKKQVWEVIEKAGMIETLGKDRIFDNDTLAIRTLGTRASATEAALQAC